MRDASIAIVGGSVAGLLSAIALEAQGARVVLLEQEPSPLPASPEAAFASWERRGAPQARHSHAFLARLHNLLAERVPHLLELLIEHGAERMRFRDLVGTLGDAGVEVPEDDEITLLACRRITFEWCLRRYCTRRDRIEFRSGARVAGWIAEAGDPPRIRGVRLVAGGELRADLVVDASGRRSASGKWLEDAGIEAPPMERSACGIFYASRFYRVRDGAEAPRLEGPIGGDLGFLKYGVFPGDGRVFSVTLAASPDDAPLRSLVRPAAFDALAAWLPATRDWVDPQVAEPVSDLAAMAKLENRRRFPVVDGRPGVLGLAWVGDALLHTNPIVGRGCTFAAIHAFLLADTWAAHGDAPFDFAVALDAAVCRELVPWYEDVRNQDQNAIEVAARIRRGEDPFASQRPDGSVDPKGYMRSLVRDGFVPALREDAGVLRAFLRIFNLLESPQDLMKNPAVFAKVLEVYRRREEHPERGPDRAAVVALLESALSRGPARLAG